MGSALLRKHPTNQQLRLLVQAWAGGLTFKILIYSYAYRTFKKNGRVLLLTFQAHLLLFEAAKNADDYFVRVALLGDTVCQPYAPAAVFLFPFRRLQSYPGACVLGQVSAFSM